MSITSELLSSIGLDDLPASVRQALEREIEGKLLRAYGREIHKLEPFLFKQGQDIGSKIAAGIMGAVALSPQKLASEAEKKAVPEWVTKIVMPAVTPFLEGVKSTAMPTVKKVALTIGAVLVGSGLVGGFLLGRARYLPKGR